MLTNQHRNEIRSAQEEASIEIQAWLAGLVRDADHGDSQSEDMLKLFLRHYRRTQSPRKAHGAVILQYNQLRIEDS